MWMKKSVDPDQLASESTLFFHKRRLRILKKIHKSRDT